MKFMIKTVFLLNLIIIYQNIFSMEAKVETNCQDNNSIIIEDVDQSEDIEFENKQKLNCVKKMLERFNKNKTKKLFCKISIISTTITICLCVTGITIYSLI